MRPSASADDHAIEFHGVTKAYGSVEVVRALDLGVRRGELVTLLGPSGSGKTTTLMMAAGFVTPDGGRILLDGRDITRTPPQRRNIGVVFQSYALFPHRTVAENIAFPLRVRGVSRAEQQRRVAEALARNLFVATFIGDMNILFGILQRGREVQFQMDAGPRIPVPDATWARPELRCALGVRPEHVDVHPAKALDPRANDRDYTCLSATVASAVYLGEAWFYKLTLPGEGLLRAKRPVGRGTERLAPGSTVNVSWHISDAVLLEA